MTDSTSLTTPARQTLEEHRALRRLLAEIDEGVSRPDAAADEGLVSLLQRLHHQLAAHFAFEEQSGLFDQIQELSPEQAHECARLCDEHGSFLERLEGLRDAEARSGAGWAAEVQGLLRDLERHETQENEILNWVLDDSAEAQD